MKKNTHPFASVADKANPIKIVLFTLTFFLSAGGVEAQESIDKNASFTIVQSNDEELQFKSSLIQNNIQSTDVITKAGVFSELTIEGFGSSNKVGEPKLPVLKQLIEVPLEAEFNIELVNFTVKEYTLKELGINFPIIPAQRSISKSAVPSKIEFQQNKDVYASNGYSSRNLVDVIPVGIMRGVRVVRLEISPVSYNPVDGKLKIYENIEVRVKYIHANIQETEDLKANTYSPYFEASYGKLMNHEPAVTRGNFTRYPVKYVIVSDPMFKTILQPFIQWKTKKGFTVVQAYTNDPLVGKTGASIQKYLKKLYTSATATDPAPSFILFVGDVSQIPAFNKKNSDGEAHVSDLDYCEYTGDKLPDVYYGRFSAATVEKLQPQIDKTLEYEQYLMPDPSFLNNAILVAGVDDDFAPKYGNGQINYGSTSYFNKTNGITASVYLYPESGNSASKVIAGVNTGCCFVNYTAHGSPTGWVDPAFSKSKITSLTNAHKYAFVIGNCCLTNKFEEDECFGEAWLRAANKGAIGYIGASNTSTWDEDYWFGVGYRSSIVLSPKYSATQLGCYDRAFHTHGEAFGEWYTTQGQILNAGNLAVTQSGSDLTNYYWEIYHLMGDPSLMPFFAVPLKMAVTYTSPVPASITAVNVKTDPYAYVAISFNGVLYGVGLADANGVVDIKLTQSFSTGNVADVVVTKQNRQPYIGKLVINNATGIADVTKGNSLVVFPNPSNDVFNITGVGLENKIEIVDIAGKVVYETVAKETTVVIDLKEQSKGVYFYKVVDPSTKQTSTGKLFLF